METTYTEEEANEASLEYFNGEKLAANVFLGKYALRDKQGCLLEKTPTDMHKRISCELARIERKYPNPLSEEEIYSYLQNFSKIIPQGSPMAGIGNKQQLLSLSNCFVINSPKDSYGGIIHTDEEQVQLMKRRGGVGFALSTLRPKGQTTANAAGTTDGIGCYMERYSNSCREVAQNGRRGALLLALNVHHPEVNTFINIKRDRTKVTGANISLQFSDEFMSAADTKGFYTQRFPVDKDAKHIIEQQVPAHNVWDSFVSAAWENAEPGALFWDTVQRMTPSDIYKDFGFESIATNPCGEIVLNAYDACRLLVVNLMGCVKNAFTQTSSFDWEDFGRTCQVAQRLMDDVVDLEIEAIEKIIAKIKSDPEEEEIKRVELTLWTKILETVIKGRRTGTGIVALGDMIASLGKRYGSEESIHFVERVYKTLAVNTYIASINMAEERGCFPVCDVSLEKGHPFLDRIFQELPPEIYAKYLRFGRRNIANTTTAPTGSVALLAQLSEGRFGTTSGIEPAFMVEHTRRKKINPNDKEAKIDFVDALGDKWTEFFVYHPGYKLWKEVTGGSSVEESPYHKATSNDVDWLKGVEIQSVAQKWVCHSISKTVNLPANATKELVAKVYMAAWKSGCKGCTVYRDGCRDGVLVSTKQPVLTGIVEHSAPKRPQDIPCEIHQATIQGERWAIFVGLIEGKPYEVMGGLAKFVQIPKSVKSGRIVKYNGPINPKARYDLHYGPEDDETIIKDIGNVFENQVHGAFTRTISLALRHGAKVQYVVEQLTKGSDQESDLFSFSKIISRVLKKHIVDGVKPTMKTCTECNSSKLVYKDGCVACLDCGYSRCD